MFQALKSQLDQSLRSARKLLQRPIRLDEGTITLGASHAALQERTRRETRRRVRHMKRDLHELLGQHPSSRKLMRHLAAVERALGSEGLEAFEALPVRVIAKALNDMESVVTNWSPTGLAELRSRMAVIVKNRPHVDDAPAPAGLAQPLESAEILPFGPTLSADVTEVDHAEFEEMERSWVGFMPTSPAPAPELQAA